MAVDQSRPLVGEMRGVWKRWLLSNQMLRNRLTDGSMLDISLALIIVLVALIGFGRGVSRGLIAMTGLLLGSELALWWADNAGDWFADVLNVDVSDARFASALGCLLLSICFVGILLANLFSQPPVSVADRVGGVAIGFWLALVGIGMVFRYYELYQQGITTALVQDSRIARFSWDQFDYVILGSVVTMIGLVLITWVFGVPSSREIETPVRATTGTSSLPVTPANTRKAGTDPAGGQESVQKTPDIVYRPSTLATDWPLAENDADEHDASAVKVGRNFTEETGPDKTVADEIPSDSETEHSLFEARSAFCPNCGAEVSEGDAFCPECGERVGSS